MHRPLVMTSGSLSGEPLARTDAEAFERLTGIADVFLLHDREIETRCDDSVAHVVAGRPMLLRRSRGYVPRPILMARPFAQPVLACGGHLTNAFCIGVGDAAYFGPHVGDLENPENVQAFEEAVERLERLLGVRPEVVAHDLHPGCLSTAYALDRPGPFKVGVRHHHAHVVSAMADGRPPIDEVPLFRALSRDDIAAVRGMIAAGLAPLAHGVGRYFDALGALVLGRARSHHQGDGALEWNLAADPAEAGEYPFALDQSSSPWTLDTRPLVRAVVEDLRAGRGAAVIAGRFHNTLAAATTAVVRAGVESAGRLPVVLSGGCFENASLAERTLWRLAPDFAVYLHREVPPGDGGLALGQAVIADALTRCDGS
jgi:hydrogenase maturation protein HypF